MRRILLLLLLTLLMPSPAAALSYSKYALDVGGADPAPMCVITIVKMNGSNFTYANPPRGRIHVNEVLQGDLQQKDFDVTWRSPQIPLCGNDPHPQQSIRTWDATQIPTFPAGSKQIVMFSDNTAKDIVFSKAMTPEVVAKVRAETAKARKAYDARWEALKKADINRLVSNSTDIITCDLAGSAIGNGMTLNAGEWLKDSTIDARPDRSIAISTDQLYGNLENKGKLILFLRASETAFKWRKPEGYPGSLPDVCPNYMPAVHKYEYKKLAFVYHPVSDPAWFIPLTPENLTTVKNAIASQKNNNAAAPTGLMHRDVALEIVQANCFLTHKRRTTYVSSRDKPFTPQELQEREKLVRKTIAELQKLYGKDNEDVVAKYEELKETLRRQGKQNEGAAALKLGKDMAARINARKLQPSKTWLTPFFQ